MPITTKPEIQGGKVVLPIHNVGILKQKQKQKHFLKGAWHGVQTAPKDGVAGKLLNVKKYTAICIAKGRKKICTEECRNTWHFYIFFISCVQQPWRNGSTH